MTDVVSAGSSLIPARGVLPYDACGVAQSLREEVVSCRTQ